MLQPEWEQLAKSMRNFATIAYWDTEQNASPPSLLGEYRGTPTIRLFKPKPKQKPGEFKKKNVVEYQYERKAKDMKQFITQHMPNAAESIVNGNIDLERFQEKAEKYALPQALLFVSKPETMPMTKFLSTEFRRKLLLAEVKPTKKNKDIMGKFGVTDLPTLIVFPGKGEGEDQVPEVVKYDGNGFTKNKLHTFLSKYALKKMRLPPKKNDLKEERGSEAKKKAQNKEPDPVKVDL